MNLRKSLVGYAFVSPWVVGFLIFTAVPFVVSIYLSFTRYDIVSPAHWVGLANYRYLLGLKWEGGGGWPPVAPSDALFWTALGVTLKYALVAVPVGIAAGVGLSLLLNLNVRGISVYRTVFYLPSIVPAVATSVVFVWLLNPQVGLVNGLLRHLGIVGPAWLDDTRWAFWSLVFMALWGVGGSMIIYLAGLKDIPLELYEAAMVDGAGAFQRMLNVTLPMLTPVIFFNLVMGIIGAFQYFTQAYVMTRGGPEDATYFYSLYLFNRAWLRLDMGYASAMAWVLFVIIMVCTLGVFRTHRRWVHYVR